MECGRFQLDLNHDLLWIRDRGRAWNDDHVLNNLFCGKINTGKILLWYNSGPGRQKKERNTKRTERIIRRKVTNFFQFRQTAVLPPITWNSLNWLKVTVLSDSGLTNGLKSYSYSSLCVFQAPPTTARCTWFVFPTFCLALLVACFIPFRVESL